MALPTTRQKLLEFCLRKLGKPVVHIDVADVQAQDRLCEALDFYTKYHLDGTEERFFKHVVTATTLTLTAAISGGDPQKGDLIVGITSTATARVWSYVSGSTEIEVTHYDVENPFVDAESITLSSGGTGTLAATDAITLGDIDNGYITIPDSILSVNGMVNGGHPTSGMFSARFKTGVEAMQSVLDSDLIGYKLARQNMALIDFMFNQRPTVTFNRVTDRLYLNWNWETDVQPGQYLLFKTLQPVDPETYPEVYGDEFLIELLTLLLKQQWGANLRKFSNVPLPGGATLSGSEIYSEASSELKEFWETMSKRFKRPQGFWVG